MAATSSGSAGPPVAAAPAAARPTDPRWAAEDRQAVAREIFRGERYRLLWISGVGAFVYPSFCLLDWIVYPQHFRLFLVARALGTLAIVAAGIATYFARSYAVAIGAFGSGFVVVAWTVAFMGHSVGQSSPYFAGMLVVQLFAAVLSTMPFWLMALMNVLVLGAYLLPLWRYPVLELRPLVSNLILLSAGALASIVGANLRGRLARQQLRSRREISRSNAELQSLHEMKDQMFQNVSHEFRTPLTLILAPIERWLAAPPAERAGEIQAGLVSIRRSALRLLNLINDLLDLARLGSAEAADETLASGPEDVRALLQRIADDVRPLAQHRGVVFEAVLPDGPLVYQVPARSLEKVVLNLLSNALKFTPSGGTVGLTAERAADGGLTISVSDTGIGIPPEAHARIFERFQQVDGGTTRRYGGTGIGLALVAELTRRLNAVLSLTSTPGQGSTFSVRLPASARTSASPLAEPAEQSIDLARRAAFAALDSDGSAPLDLREAGDHGPRLLIAEDDPQLNAELVRLLRGSYRVRSVFDGVAALQEAQRAPPDLLLSDGMMPGLDGVALARALRQDPALRNTAIVLLSARAALDDRVKGREVGVDTYLTKPFDPRELLATIEGLLRARMRVVGRYLVGERLGEGGQCEVYRAEQLDSGQVVALKMLSPRFGGGEDGENWLAREREALTRLSHPNIVRILEHGHQAQRFYMAMEYLEGKTLSALSARGTRFDAANVSAVGQALSSALSAVHSVGLVHRDVKRENVMITEHGPTLQSRVKLIDFGVVLDTTRTDHRDAEPAGTLPYMAPELLKEGSASFASDQYATGVCLYQLLTGQHPFQRETRGETIAAILGGKPTPMQKLVPDAPPALVNIISRALSSDPAERWPTLEAMADALGKLAVGAALSDADALLPQTAIANKQAGADAVTGPTPT